LRWRKALWSGSADFLGFFAGRIFVRRRIAAPRVGKLESQRWRSLIWMLLGLKRASSSARQIVRNARRSSGTASAAESARSTAASGIMLFRQLFDRGSCTYTYLLADEQTREGVLIDPVLELIDRDLELAGELGVKLLYGINTHCHADHITSTGQIKGKLDGFKSVLGAKGNEEAKADVKVKDGECVEFGRYKVQFIHTPGHTKGCHCLLVDDGEQKRVFTGDTILVRGCGRTDFQGGSSDELFDSVWKRIFTLPDNVLIFPAHDYRGRTMSTVREEKKFNPRLSKTKDEFRDIMKNLNLAYPAKIDVALPANLVCGLHETFLP